MMDATTSVSDAGPFPANRTGPESGEKVDLVLWSVIDSVLIFAILAGNILTISAIRLSRKISALISNQFILSLALSDLMVGLTLPYHFAFMVGDVLGSHETTCILRFVLIILACASSIYNLLAIAADRYIAIVHPLRYSRYMTRKMALAIIVFGWIVAFTLSTVPIYWHRWSEQTRCSIERVLPNNYVNFIVTPMFISIWITMSIVYFRIWREAVGHAKRLRNAVSYQNGPSPNDSKSVQVVLLILGCFSICWMPYFIVIVYISVNGSFKSQMVYESTFTMAVTNSCMNPIIYAWKNTNFRKAFWCLLRCKSPSNFTHKHSFITNHVPGNSKKLTANGAKKDDDFDIEMNVKTDVETIRTDITVISGNDSR